MFSILMFYLNIINFSTDGCLIAENLDSQGNINL